MGQKNLISMNKVARQDIEYILDLAQKFEQKKDSNILNGKIIASVFFEDSTRTRLSFESAVNQLGGKIIGFSGIGGTSLNKGETLADTIKMLSSYANAIVIRHNFEGAAQWASMNAKVPVINAGDGTNQHPSQTLLDLYTIKKEFKKLDNLKIAIVGDLKYGRTTHSLAMGMSHYGAEIHFISPSFLSIPDYIKNYLDQKNIKYFEHKKIEDIIDQIDVIYMTRLQKERFASVEDFEKVNAYFILDKKLLKKAKPTAIVMHPLPRLNEIAVDVDNTKHARYFEQAENGIHVRKAILAYVLDLKGK